MATLDGMRLFDAASLPTSGGAFLLNGMVKENLTASAPGGWAVQVAAGGSYVVASNPITLAGYTESRNSAFLAAQQGLDLFAISRSADLGIRDAETWHLIWWPEPSGQILRVASVVTINALLRARVEIRDADGNVRPDPPSPPVLWHDSLRYFRLAQITDDLFDAYRNLYLGLESILDRIAPQIVDAAGKPKEGEGVWFKRALTAASTRLNLAPYASRGSTDPVQGLYDDLYVKTRTALFHAKSSRPSFLPHSSGKEQEGVTAVVERLARLFIALAEKELNTRSPMGGFFASGFNWLTDPLKTRLRLQATDDAEAANPDNTVVNPSGGTVINLTTRNAPELEAPFVRSFLGSATVQEVNKLSRLTVIAARGDDGLIAGSSIEGMLTLGGIDRLEGQMSIRMRNPQIPKRHFAS